MTPKEFRLQIAAKQAARDQLDRKRLAEDRIEATKWFHDKLLPALIDEGFVTAPVREGLINPLVDLAEEYGIMTSVTGGLIWFSVQVENTNDE